MKKTAIVLLAATLVAATAGCSRVYPPRVNLEPMGTIGLIHFRSEAKGNIAEYATQVFLEILVRSQPGARIKELGREDEVLRDIEAERLSPDALEALRERFGVDAVVFGTLDVSDVRPRVDLAAIISTLSVSAEVEAVLTARLLDTRDGTTLWTDSARDRKTVANVSVVRGGGSSSTHATRSGPTGLSSARWSGGQAAISNGGRIRVTLTLIPGDLTLRPLPRAFGQARASAARGEPGELLRGAINTTGSRKYCGEQ